MVGTLHEEFDEIATSQEDVCKPLEEEYVRFKKEVGGDGEGK